MASRLNKGRAWVVTAVCVTGGLAAATASGAVFDGFENYPDGPLAGNDAWTISTSGSSQSASVISTDAFSGNKSAQIDDGSAGKIPGLMKSFSKGANDALDEDEPSTGGTTLSVAVKSLQAPGANVSDFVIDPVRGFDDVNDSRTLIRGLVEMDRGGDFLFRDSSSNETTLLDGWVANRWYIVKMIFNDESDGDVFMDVRITDTVDAGNSTFTPNLTSGNNAGRDYIIGIQFETVSTPSGSFRIDDVQLAIPEPGSLALLGLGGLLMGGRRRR